MGETLQLPLDWHALQPSLVPTVQRAAVEGHSALHGLTHPRMLRRLLKEEL